MSFTIVWQLYRSILSTRRRVCAAATGAVLVLLALTAGLYGWLIEPCNIQLVQYEIVSPDLPPAFDSTTILFISDIHYGRWGTYDLRQKIVDIVEKEKPDLLLFGGDFAEKKFSNVHALAKSIKPLSAPLGKFAVPGNHDYIEYSMEKTMDTFCREGNIQNLTDKGVWVTKGNDRIRLFGTDFLWDRHFPLQFPYYEISDRSENDFVILLTHSPDAFDKFDFSQRHKIDLTLAGHSHGGQITVFGLYAPVTVLYNQKYRTGRVDVENNSNGKKSTVITSNGIGTAGIPVRFFANPQIVKITLKRAN